MTDSPASIPAGWYPDPSGQSPQRWWDGVGWTQHVAGEASVAAQPAQYAGRYAADQHAGQPYTGQPYATQPYGAQYASPAVPDAAPKVPAGTPVDTPWVWIITFLPLVSTFSLFLLSPDLLLPDDLLSSDPSTAALASYSIFLSPVYWLVLALGFLISGLAIWFSYLDYAALGRFGYPKRFHWAWSFLALPVYVIGRSVVVSKQADGRGRGPMWAVIGVYVATLATAILWTVWFTSVLLTTIGNAVSTYSY